MSYPPYYPPDYQIDNTKGALLQKMEADQVEFTSAVRRQYKQLNFPYNPEYITQINVGKNNKMPLGGKELVGLQTKETCAMNAAIEYNKSNGVSLDAQYNNDIFCKISKNGQIFYEGLYSKLNVQELAAASAPATTTEPSPIVPYEVQLTGLFLPSDGDRNGYIELTTDYPINIYKTFGIWIGIKPETSTQQNAMLYYENGALKKNAYPITQVLIIKNTFLPFVVKYMVDNEKSIRFYPKRDGAKMPFVLKTKTKIIAYTIKTPQNGENTGNLVYYNFQESTGNLGKCTIYNSKNLSDADKTGIESSDNYDKFVVELVVAFPLSSNLVKHVGLNNIGVLTTYYVGSVPTPVKTNGNVIEAKNKGRNGYNRETNYQIVLDDAVTKMTDSKTTFAVPTTLTNFDRKQLIRNDEWAKVQSHYLGSINNTGQTSDGPSMKITMDRPLFSKDYKLKMALEKSPTDTQYFLKIYKTIKNTNSFFSILPDFKMGKLFVADENSTATTMYLVKDENKTTDVLNNGKLEYSTNYYQNYFPPANYNLTGSEYTMFEEIRNEYCKEKARGKSHFFTIEIKNKKNKYCVVPNKSDQEIVFLPKQPQHIDIINSTLYVPNKIVTSGNVKTDVDLNLSGYKYSENAYATKPYADFNVSINNWDPKLNLSDKNPFYNQTLNYGQDAIGLSSVNNSNSVAEVMPTEQFTTYTQETIDQINNYTTPRFTNYLDKQTRVNQNVKDISGNITQINDKYAFMSDTVKRTQGVQNNEFYDFTGPEIYSLREDRALVPALLKDQQTMIVEHNNLFIVSTITVATLLVSAIFVSSN